MNQRLIPLLPLFAFGLAACLGGDGDGGADVTHAIGHWQLNWECDQMGETITGCDIGEIYDSGLEEGGVKQLSVVWGGDHVTGPLRGNAFSVAYDHGPVGSPGHYYEEAVYTFDRANHDIFSKSSVYSGDGVSGTCSGSGRRIPATQTECMPVN